METPLSVAKTVLAALVAEKVITAKKAKSALSRIEKQYLRGVMPPVEFDTLVKMLSEDS